MIEKLVLTMAQIEEYDPPPNPAKLTDSRANKYIEKFGDKSWEVDALPPEILQSIIRDAFSDVVDKKLMNVIVSKEDYDKQRLRDALKKIMKTGTTKKKGAKK